MDNRLIPKKVQAEDATEVLQARNRETLSAWVSQRDRNRHSDNVGLFLDRYQAGLYRQFLFHSVSAGACWVLLSHIVSSQQLRVPLDNAPKDSKKG